MLNFGTSAYLKLLAVNPKPRDSELRKRINRIGKGYDFHKAMRRIAVGHASGVLTIEEVNAKISGIGRLPERNAAQVAIDKLSVWLNGARVRPLQDAELRAESPRGLFNVKFSPDFEIDEQDGIVRVHLWNTAKPSIKLREAIGTLGLFANREQSYSIGILSLRTNKLFVLRDLDTSNQLAALLARDIERRIDFIRDEIEKPIREERTGRRGIL